ncbi:MAG: bifunctional phosphoribosylaminoimidazolecarboxamide formyltransferase/inosine monophosphate cyclohydrolase [Chloroflexi bacterium]|nr:bifunctional phosphoribosylaminoimidazolecarboxamide formyltransferase/inosine monophosphate cyclohydrolase [Chloroflexota bacterium]
MPRALFSVSDKTGIIELGQALATIGWDLVASGGTAKALSDAGLRVTPIEQLTGLPEMLGGRVKTLHPAIHAPILARDHSKDLQELTEHGYAPIDLVVCNLYPFQQTVAKPDVKLEDAIENIDIGGVTLLRAAAKNFARVTVLVDPADYGGVAEKIVLEGKLSLDERRRLATKAFDHTRSYDTAIYAYLAGEDTLDVGETGLGDSLTIGVKQIQSLRYGENPHQNAGLYAAHEGVGPLGGMLLQGKELSYNNLLDADSAWRAVSSFPPKESAAVVIVKHLNPTGIATAENAAAAFAAALESDPVSAFGGVIAVNRTVDAALVEALGSLFVEVLIAPKVDNAARRMLETGRKNCRVLEVPHFSTQSGIEFRSILGGVLAQERDLGDPEGTEWQVVSQRRPTQDEIKVLKFAWVACQHVKSNAIVIAGINMTFGIGGGLPSRVDATRLAVEKAGSRARGAVLASDAFFPFADGIQVAAAAGVSAIIQPGGSIRDQEVIAAVDAAGMAMVFTKSRHFRH